VTGLTLLGASFDLLDAAIENPTRLEQLLGATLADGWSGFSGSLPSLRDSYSARESENAWGTLLFVLDEPRTLVGLGGYKGGPSEEGVVEIGYALAPAFRRRGLATEAVRQMVLRGFSDPRVRAIDAHTLANLNPSARILEKAGFQKIGDYEDLDDGSIWHWRLRRVS
jgi:RimJ/RimL family protein N-acetyltransferase